MIIYPVPNQKYGIKSPHPYLQMRIVMTPPAH